MAYNPSFEWTLERFHSVAEFFVRSMRACCDIPRQKTPSFSIPGRSTRENQAKSRLEFSMCGHVPVLRSAWASMITSSSCSARARSLSFECERRTHAPVVNSSMASGTAFSRNDSAQSNKTLVSTSSNQSVYYITQSPRCLVSLRGLMLFVTWMTGYPLRIILHLGKDMAFIGR